VRYKVILPRDVLKALKRIAVYDHRAIVNRLHSLAEIPRPKDVKELSGVPLWRVRVRGYRIVYHINDDKKKLVVVKITRSREDTYRGL
jgi:mRNA-degrading endonuclease RelE of RelBE toxin-antitoxin system